MTTTWEDILSIRASFDDLKAAILELEKDSLGGVAVITLFEHRKKPSTMAETVDQKLEVLIRKLRGKGFDVGDSGCEFPG